MVRRGALILVLLTGQLLGERLPVRKYSPADGLLAESAVFDITEDARGYLWISQPDGVSRFDGVNFRTYTERDGLPAGQEVYQTLAARDGSYWAATGGGLARYEPNSRGKLFKIFEVGSGDRSNLVYQLIEDGSGGLWLGTFGGLYHAVLRNNHLETRLVLKPDAPAGTEPKGNFPILTIIRDRNGAVWAAGHYCGVYRITPNGVISHFTEKNGLPRLTAGRLFEDREGHVWLASAVGLLLLNSQAGEQEPLCLKRVDTTLRHPENGVRGICQTPDGHLWLATVAGLLEYDGEKVRTYSQFEGLPGASVWSVHADRLGNVWLGSDSGLTCLRRSGITSFAAEDGMPAGAIAGLYRTRAGELAVVTHVAEAYAIHGWARDHFYALRPKFPAQVKLFGWATGNNLLQDHTGEWWVATFDGLCRFARTAHLEGLAHAGLKYRYTMQDGLPSNNIQTLYEDRDGNIWIGCMFPPAFGLARWNRLTGKIENLSQAAGIPAGHTAKSFGEDGAGGLWVGFLEGGLSRFANDKFEPILKQSETVNSLRQDAKGVFWAATSRGLLRIEEPGAEHPKLSWSTEADGFASNDVLCVLPAWNGRLFVGTGKGLDEWELDRKRVTHFHRSDGLAGERITDLVLDGDRLWIGTVAGLSLLKETAPAVRPPPSVLISEVKVGRGKEAVSDLGEAKVLLPRLNAAQNSLQISYAAAVAALGQGGELRYTYRLVGATEDWSLPTHERTVLYPNLPPGGYEFHVKAQDVVGQKSTQAASVEFVIPPPVWKRWWFIALEALGVAGLLTLAYRFRLRQILRVERMRERIARDLHDEVGSSLTRIAVLIEVSRRGDGESLSRLDPLGRAATIARETTASMGDIVWAINPHRDSVDDLTIRLRRYAADVLGGVGIDCVVRSLEGGERKLESETRRQLLLLAKEAVHNAAKHSKAHVVEIELMVAGGALVLRVKDDGIGFEPQPKEDGQGLESMKARARRMGGEISILSERGAGTLIECRLPVRAVALKT